MYRRIHQCEIFTTVTVLREHPLDIVILAAKQALEFGRTDTNSLKMFAARQASARTGEQMPLEEPYTPSEVAEWHPDLSIYDRLGVATHGERIGDTM